ncbi:MAG: hypothetical protein LC798_16715 [Chloroflexi bacterium]|nr:hypothetical protein [Chloroflexota bacterium]
MARLRVVGYTVQPQMMMDDGESLVPLPVAPVSVSAAEWPNVVELVAKAVEQLRQQVEHAVPPAAQNGEPPNRAARPPKTVTSA